jgi:phage tail-like protein
MDDMPMDGGPPISGGRSARVAQRPPDGPSIPPGLTTDSLRLLEYLPPIYHSEFMSHFLALFESVLLPIEWTVDNFDLYLSPGTAPGSFLPWLSHWFGLAFDDTWSDAQRRALIADAHWLFETQGTKKAMSRVLEIYTGQPPEIIDQDVGDHTFIVKLPFPRKQVAEDLIHHLIDAYKPAHTSYQLKFSD